MRVPFEVDKIEELVVYHDLQFDSTSLNEEARQLAEEIRRELEPHYIRPVPHLVDEEAYTVVSGLEAPADDQRGKRPLSAEKLAPGPIAARSLPLLTQES